MTPVQNKPIVHGRDHMAGGPDPIPGIADLGGGSGVVMHRIGTTEDRWYAAAALVASSFGSNTTVANRLEAFPFIASRDMTLDRIAVQVTGSTGVGNCRLGFYSSGANLYPDALLFDTGSFSITTDGAKIQTISQALTAATLYWAAIDVSASSIQLRSVQVADTIPILGMAAWSGTTNNPQSFGWYVTHSFAALPNPFTAGGTPMTAFDGIPAAIVVRGT